MIEQEEWKELKSNKPDESVERLKEDLERYRKTLERISAKSTDPMAVFLADKALLRQR